MTANPPTPDILVQNHGSICLFYPLTPLGVEWIEEHVDAEARWWCRSLVVEHRYAQALAEGMTEDGLRVE